MSDFIPEVSPRIRTAVYWAGLFVTAAGIVTSNVVDDSVALLISNAGAGVGFLASALGVAFRPTSHGKHAKED